VIIHWVSFFQPLPPFTLTPLPFKPTLVAVFEMDFFRKKPEPFFLLARELYPGHFSPTPTHHFLRLLHDKGLLLRCYTQNIDSLESLAGVPADRLVAAHGNFDAAHCIDCRKEYPPDYVREHVFKGEVCRCARCEGLVKPDIVFFGENLPRRFFQLAKQDLPQADLLIVMGTSLVVHPFAGLVDQVTRRTPRLLLNRERVGEVDPEIRKLAGVRVSRGFNFGEGNYRDALHLGNVSRRGGMPEEGVYALLDGHVYCMYHVGRF
jgi:NAD+-dependent protein deacetylase sirtuin 2